MSDPAIATKAPESDLAENSSNPEISALPAETSPTPSLGEHCTSDRALPADQSSQSSGEVVKFGETDVYVSKPADYPTSPGRLLLLLTSGTGVHSTNNQLQADQYAKNGYVVVMPDLFSGDPAPNSTAMADADAEQSGGGLIERVKMRLVETAKSFMIDMWLARHGPEKVLPTIMKVLERAREEFADAAANGDGVYAAGYCFGARYVIILAGKQLSISQSQDGHPSSHQTGSNTTEQGEAETATGPAAAPEKRVPVIRAGVAAHATLVTRDDFKSVKTPLSLICVEDDPLFPQEILDFGKTTLDDNGIVHEVEMYAGVPHGFAVTGDYGSPAIQQAQSAAFERMLRWLAAH